MLEQFRREKLAEIATLAELRQRGELEPGYYERADFWQALRQPDLAVIAEYKRASPSRGVICETLGVEDVARQYRQAGANAVSILTEPRWFHGDSGFLLRAWQAMQPDPIPLLRKDFIFDPLQVLATSRTPASAFLLITRLIPDARSLRNLREYGESLGMHSVVEIFDRRDLAMARDSGARIIQVNARDLDSLKVDRAACISVLQDCGKQGHELWIAASGMDRREHLRQAADAGFDAVLVGTALMAGANPGAALASLLQGGA